MFITVLGPTASGKTRLAAHLAASLDAEIISADSRQVYRRMDIGTGKDLDDYVVNGKKIPNHLIDMVEPGYEYNVFEYQRDFYEVYKNLQKQEKNMILCGGSGMYIEAVLQGYKLIRVPVNPELRRELEHKTDKELITILSAMKKLHNTTDIDTRKRMIRAIEIEKYYFDNTVQDDFPKISTTIFGTDISREKRREKITERLKERLEQGMVDEVQSLLNEGLTTEKLKFYGLEYKFVSSYLAGELSYDEMFTKLNTAIHQFAKRQMTWFRKMERNGYLIHWIDALKPIDDQVEDVLSALYRDR